MFSSSGQTDNENSRLDVLQRDSWQLELIITGFSLAGMISGIGEFIDLTEYGRDILFQYGIAGKVVRGIVSAIQIAYFVVLLHFFFNVVVRCLWIGALAMRHVIGTDKYLKDLAYEPIFLNFLRKRHGDFDRYVNGLDDIASLIFAITFFLVAILIGVMVFITLSFGVLSMMTDFLGLESFLLVFIAVSLILGPMILLYIIDFAAGGVMKGTGKWYFYFYRLMGWLSFARLYRPLYYLIISKPWGRNLIWLIIPYTILFISIPLLDISPVSYFSEEDFSDSNYLEQALHDRNYADTDGFVASKSRIYLASDVVEAQVLKVHVPLYERYQEGLYKLCPELGEDAKELQFGTHDHQPSERSPWRASERPNTIPVDTSGHSHSDTTLIDCLLDLFELDVDGTSITPENVMLSSGKLGAPFPEMIAYFSLRETEPGLHRVKLQEWRPHRDNPDSLFICCTQIVPFYFAPEK